MRRHGFSKIIAALALGLAMLWWLLMLSPWLYAPPQHWPPPAPALEHHLFVYGTLRTQPLRSLIVLRWVESEPASLPGFERQGLDLLPVAEGEVVGERLRLSARELQRLDRYERLGHRYYRDCLLLADGSAAWVYRRLPLPVEGVPAADCVD